VLVAPAAPGHLARFARRHMIVYAPSPPLGDLRAALAPPILAAAGAGVVIGARVLGRDSVERAAPIARAGLVLLIAWHLVPQLVLYSVSKLTTTRIFWPRYALCGAPGLALLAAWSARALEPRARVAAAALVVALSLSAHARRYHTAEDWRAVQAAVVEEVRSPDTPVLIGPGFIEAARLDWVENEGPGHDYLLAPIWRYPMPGKLVLLPYRLDEETEAWLERVVEREKLASAERFVVVARGLPPPPWRAWLSGRLAGFTSRARDLNAVTVIAFERKR
jgi:hypothetical protein